MKYRVWNIKFSDGVEFPSQTRFVDPKEVAEACHGGGSAADYIRERLLEDHRADWYGQGNRPAGGYREAFPTGVSVVFEMRQIQDRMMIGTEIVTYGHMERSYGGPEEGGWYYDVWKPVRSWIVPKGKVNRVTRLLESMIWGPTESRKKHWTDDREVHVGEAYEESYPKVRPHYC